MSDDGASINRRAVRSLTNLNSLASAPMMHDVEDVQRNNAVRYKGRSPMSALERNPNGLLPELRQRLLVAYARPVEKLTGTIGLIDPAPAAGNATSRGLVSRLLAAELKTRRGQQPLWLTFWVYGVAVCGFLGLLYGMALYTATAAVQEALLIGLAAYTVWVLISLWRCTEGRKQFSGVLARFLVVPWAANVTLVLAFTQVELLVQFVDAGKEISP